MKTKHFYILSLFFFTFFAIGCGDDDNMIIDPDAGEEQTENPEETSTPDPDPDPAVVLAEERQSVLNGLTATDKKVWKITEAILTNTSGTIDISSNFNVVDDELIFINSVFQSSKTDFSGTLEWRPGNGVETEGASSEETLLDLYESPAKFAFDFVGDSNSELESDGFTFEYIDENTITGTIQGEASSTVAVTLKPKTSEDYIQVPNEPLSFSQAFSYPSNAIDGFAPGMVGSNSSNSIFIVTREGDLRGDNNINPERVSKYNIGTNTLEDKLFFQSDFVSKQLHIIDNKLKVVGGQNINTYDTNFQAEPTSSSYHGEIALSRHGSAVIDDNIYIVGGSLGANQGVNNIGNEIYKWDDLNANLEAIATMPETRSGARAEIVQNKLYVFGGTEEFVGSEAKNTIYIYDFETASITTELLPQALHFTYTGKQENLIYVAGQVKTYTDDADADGNPDGFLTIIDNEPYVGVYDTESKEFTELATDLSSPETETIHSMAILSGKMYILYGKFEPVAEGEFQNWDVLVADLD